MKPCPFCGKQIDKTHYVYGVHYNAEMELWVFGHTCNYDPAKKPTIDLDITLYGMTMEEVVERWNSRAEVKACESV